MRCIVDAQLPRSLADLLVELGYDAIHVTDLPKAGDTSDGEITAFADDEDRVVFTKDRDFRHTHVTGGHPRQLLLIRLGNVRNSELLARVRIHHEAIAAAFTAADFIEVDDAGLILHHRAH